MDRYKNFVKYHVVSCGAGAGAPGFFPPPPLAEFCQILHRYVRIAVRV